MHVSRRSQRKAPDEEDTIALTSQGSNNKHSVCTEVADNEPWSPTVDFGQARVERMVSIKGGKAVSRMYR